MEEKEQPVGSARKRTEKRVMIGVLAAAALVAVFLLGWYGHYFSLDSEVRTYLWAKSVAEKNYYQPVDEAELYDRLYGTLDFDRYSRLFTPEEYDAYLEEGKGHYSGIGLSIYTGEGREAPLHIFSAADGSPAALAGIRKGMYLCAFGTKDGTLTAGSLDDLNAFLQAHAKEELTFRCGYEPDGSDGRLFTFRAATYQAAYVSYRDSAASLRFRYDGEKRIAEEGNELLAGADEKTALIRLDEFSGNAAAEFQECLSFMKERGRENLILDLRSNGGGYLDILGEIASYLLRDGTGDPVVAVAKYRDKEEEYLCDGSKFGDYFTPSSRVYLLADENTASASECLIGALVEYNTTPFSQILLRENENGVAKTYGKGIMQSHFKNLSGAAMKLTVATIHWPVTERCIHGVGVTPADGAVPVPAPLLCGTTDPMLEEALARISA